MRLNSYSIFFCQVGRLAGVVQDVCERTSCTVVLDMGSGLVSRETHPVMLASVFIHWPSHRPVFDRLPPPFFHTVQDQTLDSGKAWDQG